MSIGDMSSDDNRTLVRESVLEELVLRDPRDPKYSAVIERRTRRLVLNGEVKSIMDLDDVGGMTYAEIAALARREKPSGIKGFRIIMGDGSARVAYYQYSRTRDSDYWYYKSLNNNF